MKDNVPHGNTIAVLTPEGAITSGGFILYLHSLKASDRIDSRFLEFFMRSRMGLDITNNDWFALAQQSQSRSDGVAFKRLDVRTAPNGNQFMMLDLLQACVFVMREATPFDFSCDDLEGQIFDFVMLHRRQILDPDMTIPMLSFHLEINKTFEQITEEQFRITRNEIEKRIEQNFGERLQRQGIKVQYQVHCENGIADIVTPSAIYEVKASLTRKELHHAIAQVLAYRACINPQLKAFVIGSKPKGESVAISLAHSLGVEVIIWDEEASEQPVISSQNFLDQPKNKKKRQLPSPEQQKETKQQGKPEGPGQRALF
jgi:hypothetical protein